MAASAAAAAVSGRASGQCACDSGGRLSAAVVVLIIVEL